MNLNKERLERVLVIQQKLSKLGDDLKAAVDGGNVFEVERICIEMDYQNELRREAMEINPLKVTYGQDTDLD